MRKLIVKTFCALMLCSLLFITVGTALASEPGYERTSYLTQVIPTIDGRWTSEDEWTDGNQTWIGTSVVFTSTLDSHITRWIVEFLSDTTDDPGDYLQFCFDGHQYGGSAPQLAYTRSFRIDGHTELSWYMGDGIGWTDRDMDPSELEWANSLSSSPMSSTPHWIYEFQKVKNTGDFTLDDVWNFFLRVYDASNPGISNRPSWPPTDPNSPDEYGIENYSTEPIPEGFTFVVMALLSTVSMLVGYKYLVKRKETKAQ